MEQSYIRGMDGLRALGVICVLIAHFWPRPDTMLDYFHFGRFGVVLFFTLSGYLVVNSLMKLRKSIELGYITRSDAIRTFYYRRALRIFPIYYLALLIVYFFQATPDINNHIQWLIFYISNYSVWFDFNLQNTEHFWTLAIEEQFYLIIPFFVIFVDKKYFFKVLLLLIIGGILTKGVDFYYSEIAGENYLFNKVTHPLWGCLEGLCLGGMLACKGSNTKFANFFAKPKIFLLSLALVVLISLYRYLKLESINQDFIYAVTAHSPYALLSLAAICILFKNQTSKLTDALEYSPIRWIGRISYGIYIFHYLAKPYIAQWVSDINNSVPSFAQPYTLFVAGFSLSVFVASLSFIFIEKPIMKLRSKNMNFQHEKCLPCK